MPSGNEETGAGSEPARRVHESETIRGPDPGAVPVGAHDAKGDAPTPGGVAALDEFARALVEIGLIDQAELDSFTADSAEGVLGLSRALVEAGKLTTYQAAAVYQKKSRGLLIGNYLILDKLGQGGMGVVFKARHRRLARVGALKILPPSFARDRDAVMRFRREVEAAGRLKHPNLVAAQDADEDRGVHFLVMDYVEGRDLDRIVRDRGPMPVAQAIDCLIQAARGLEAAHAQGIIHRDIKPANLMLDNAGTVRVLDLGLARIVDAGNPFGKSTAGRLTQSGMYMGTIDFMAPEQAEDSHRVDHRADIYSLGCTTHYLITGREPFLGETVLKRLMAHMERPAPSLRNIRPDVPPALDAVYLKMMAKRPEDRPASMTEVISLLEACKLTAVAPKSKPELMVFNEQPVKRAGAPRARSDPSIFARPKDADGQRTSNELDLEDLVMDVRPEPPPSALSPARGSAPAPTFRGTAATPSRSRPARRPRSNLARTINLVCNVAAVVAVGTGGVWLALILRGDRPQPKVAETAPSEPDRRPQPATEPKRSSEITRTIADGKTGRGPVRNPSPSAAARAVVKFAATPSTVPAQPPALEPRKDLKRDGAFRFPQGEAIVLCDRTDLRVSAWNDPSYLYVQAILWNDDSDAPGTAAIARPLYDNAALALDLDADDAMTPRRDRIYYVNQLGLQCVVFSSAEGSATPIQKDTKGRCSIRFVEQEGGKRVRVDSLVIPLGEIGKRPAENLKLAYYGDSRHPEFTINSAGRLSGFYHANALPFNTFHSLTLSGRRKALDVARVFEELDKSNALPQNENSPVTAAAANRPNSAPVDALTEFGKSNSTLANDARLSIERGRTLAGLGRLSEANDYFAQAAQLAPDQPQSFVDAGWWVAGPYPLDRTLPAPLQSDPAPDPSKPADVKGVPARRWQNVRTEPPGKVDLGAVFHADNIAAYALSIVYSASEQDVAVILSNDDQANYWLNGRHFLQTPFIPFESGRTMLMTLKTGRNTILAEVINQHAGHSVSLRISRAPIDLVRAFSTAEKWAQVAESYDKVVANESGKADWATHNDAGRACAELGRWKDAAAAFRRAYSLDSKNYEMRQDLLRCYLALGDADSYEPLCKKLIEDYRKDQNPRIRNNVIWTAALLPGVLPSYSEVLQIASKLMDMKTGTGVTYLNTYGAIVYRAKQYSAAVNYLTKSVHAKEGKGDAFDLVFLAMARHRLKQPGASEALKEAVERANDAKYNWESRIEIRTLLEEARMELSLP